jgi:YebC/PmpR family DNA-binding regulatory protein
MFEGYGPSGAAVLVNVATDNRNRTVADIRHVFSKNGGNMAEQGAVAWMFERKSQIFLPGDQANEDQLMGVVLDAGADDLRNDGDQWEVLSAPEAHYAVLKSLEAAGLHPGEASIAMVPKNIVKLVGKSASNMMRLSEALEEHDDVQNVYSNFEIDDEELEALAQ